MTTTLRARPAAEGRTPVFFLAVVFALAVFVAARADARFTARLTACLAFFAVFAVFAVLFAACVDRLVRAARVFAMAAAPRERGRTTAILLRRLDEARADVARVSGNPSGVLNDRRPERHPRAPRVLRPHRGDAGDMRRRHAGAVEERVGALVHRHAREHAHAGRGEIDLAAGAGDRAAAAREVRDLQLVIERRDGHDRRAVGRLFDEAEIPAGAIGVVAGGGDDQAPGRQRALAGLLEGL